MAAHHVRRQATGPQFTVIYAFHGRKDGAFPDSPLVADASGALYGTTQAGGAKGDGTVYKLTPAGKRYTETVLYSFKGGDDGREPGGAIAFDAAGNLYGTTLGGGKPGFGTVFALRPSSSGYVESQLYAFAGGTDGEVPAGGVTLGGRGNIFGVTQRGGSNTCTPSCGVAYRISFVHHRYQESVLHRFVSSRGSDPEGPLLLDPSGTLFGISGVSEGQGQGNAFALVPSNGVYKDRVLFNFPGSSGGDSPVGGLIEDGAGNLYGTNFAGGISEGGNAYVLMKHGNKYAEVVLHEFTGGADGFFPFAPLVFDQSGALYGTTSGGGCASSSDCGNGTIFSLAPSSSGYTYAQLHAFSGADGNMPQTGLLPAGGALFGVTLQGGNGESCRPDGCGVVFKLTL